MACVLHAMAVMTIAFVALASVTDLKVCAADSPEACSTGGVESMMTGVGMEDAVTKDMTVQLLQTQSTAMHAMRKPGDFNALMHSSGMVTNGTLHQHRKWAQMGKNWILPQTNFVHKGNSKHVQPNCKNCEAGFNLETGCGAIYDEMTQKIDINTAMSIYQGSFPDPDCVYCDFNPIEHCEYEFHARECSDCADGFNRDTGCGAMLAFFAGTLSEKEAMTALFNSFPCGDAMKQCDFNLESACAQFQNDQKAAQRDQLEAVKQCTDRENCETCLYSWQCKGYGGNPSPIYCCPRMKRCIDVTPEGIQAGRQGCFGDRVCPNMCSESPYRSPDYPFDCAGNCPGWNPLTWVTC